MILLKNGYTEYIYMTNEEAEFEYMKGENYSKQGLNCVLTFEEWLTRHKIKIL